MDKIDLLHDKNKGVLVDIIIRSDKWHECVAGVCDLLTVIAFKERLKSNEIKSLKHKMFDSINLVLGKDFQ